MKKSLIALAALAAVGVASAQSSVTISGGYNLGVGKTISSAGVVDTRASVVNNLSNGNNISFTVNEDLGGGLRAIASTNIRYDASTGLNTSNTASATGTADAFAQNSSIALAGSFGQLTMGRFTSGVAAPIGGYDPFFTSNAGVAISAPPPRTNDTVQYATPTMSGFRATIETSLRAGTGNATASAVAKDAVQYTLTYNQGPVSLMVGGGNTQQQSNNKISGVGASYNMGVAIPTVAYAKTGNGATAGSTEETAVGVTVPLGAISLLAGHRKTEGSGTAALNTKRNSVGAHYILSKRTRALAEVAKETDKDTAWVLGLRHTF